MTRVNVLKGEKQENDENTAISIRDLQLIYDYLNENKERLYDENSKKKKIANLLKQEKNQNTPDIMNQISDIMNENIYKWKVEQLEQREDGNEAYILLSTDNIQKKYFRNLPLLIPSSTTGPLRIQYHNNKLLIFLFIDSENIKHFQTILKNIFKEINIIISVVKWDPNSFIEIKRDASKVKEEKLSNIESRVNMEMSAPDGLENTHVGESMEKQGEIRAVKFDSIDYSGNWVKVDGENGIISSTLDETQTIRYIKEKLLPYSDY